MPGGKCIFPSKKSSSCFFSVAHICGWKNRIFLRMWILSWIGLIAWTHHQTRRAPSPRSLGSSLLWIVPLWSIHRGLCIFMWSLFVGIQQAAGTCIILWYCCEYCYGFQPVLWNKLKNTQSLQYLLLLFSSFGYWALLCRFQYAFFFYSMYTLCFPLKQPRWSHKQKQ